MRIFYVGLEVESITESDLKCHFGIETPKHLHSTVIYSRRWFPYKHDRDDLTIIKPPYLLDKFNDLFVLRFESVKLLARHIELKANGADWDYPDFKSHITLGRKINTEELPNFNIILYREYYRTWDEI